MPPGGLKREDIDPSPDAVSGVGVPATMGIKVHIGSPAPLGHPSGNPLPGHRPLTPVAGEHPVIRFAAAQALKQKKRLCADADRSGLAPLAQEINLTATLNRLNIPPSQAAQLRHPAAQEIAALHHHEVPASRGTAGDFKAAGCPLVRAGKMNAREANGLALVRTMLQASGRDPETPWLMWTQACQGLMATWPTLPRHPRDVERIADGCANHSLDAVRYGVQWWRAKWKTGSKGAPHPLMWR